MSTASDGCGSFNCMSALNDGVLNSYTFHTIAFRPGKGPGRQPGISVAIWRGRQSPCWVIGGLTPSPMHQTNCYTVLKPHIGCQATGLMKHARTYHHIYTCSQEMVKYELQDVFYTLWDTKDPKTHLIAVSSWSRTPIRTNTRIHTPTHRFESVVTVLSAHGHTITHPAVLWKGHFSLLHIFDRSVTSPDLCWVYNFNSSSLPQQSDSAETLTPGLWDTDW